MKASKTADVAIIGAGIIGCSTALSLGRAGFKVAVIDPKFGPGQGTTSFSSGICRSFYSILDSVKFSYEGYHYYKNWKDFVQLPSNSNLLTFRIPGAMILNTSTSKKFLDTCIPLMQQIGIEIQQWDNRMLLEKVGIPFGMDLSGCYVPRRISDPKFGEPEPGKTIDGACFVPETGYVSDPQLAAFNLYTSAKINPTTNVEFLFGHSVTDIIVSQNESPAVTGVEMTNSKTNDRNLLSCAILVNCAGPHSSSVNKFVYNGPRVERSITNDMKIKTKPMRQEVAFVPVDKVRAFDLERSNFPISIDLDHGIYFRPEIGNKLLVGGIEADCDEPLAHFIDGDPDLDLNTNLTDEYSNLVYRLCLRFPRISVPSSLNTQGIVSSYDVSDDWAPIYDCTNVTGYYVAIGTSGNQFKNAAVVGDMMTKIIQYNVNNTKHGGPNAQDVKPLQYQLNFVREKDGSSMSIDTSKFSRLREPNTTSASVMG